MSAALVLEDSISASSDILNPFIQKLKFTTYDKIKIAVLSVTLLPIRVIVISIFYILAWLLVRIVLTKNFQAKPISGWRRDILKPMVLGSLRVAFLGAGFLWVPIKGTLASQKDAPILIMAPHSSFFEMLPVILLGGPSILAKAETSKVPIYGDFMSFSQPVYVQQNDKLSRKQTIREVRYRAFSNEGWGQIAIFPEGTCTNRTALITFKQGAFNPGVPVQPVCLKFPNRLDTCTWAWQGAGVVKTFWLSLCQFVNHCEIEILPVYKPSKAEVHDPRLYTRNVQKLIANHLKIPTSDWAFDDIRFIRRAKKENAPLSIAMVKFMKLRNRLGIEEENLINGIRNLQNRLKSCSTTLSDHFAFAQLLEIESSDMFKEYFDSIDEERVGTLDARIYLCCMWLLRTEVSIWKRVEEAFKVLSDGELDLNSPGFCLLIWVLLTVPKTKAEDVFKALDKGTGTVECGDFIHCLQNSPSAIEILNADTNRILSTKEPIYDNAYF